MDLKRLYEILNDTTVQLRKGKVITRSRAASADVVTFDMMPCESEAKDLVKVDMILLSVGVDAAEAEKHRAELIRLLDDYPDPRELAGGPSYISVGADIGDQGAAFQLFALGKVLGLWEVVTPISLGFDPEASVELAGSGFVMITGYTRKRESAA